MCYRKDYLAMRLMLTAQSDNMHISTWFAARKSICAIYSVVPIAGLYGQK